MMRLKSIAGAALLALCAGQAAVASDGPRSGGAPSRLDLMLHMASAFADGLCASLLQKDTHLVADGRITGAYRADNAQLHWCLYEHEVASACQANRTCPTYEAWSASNPQLNPMLPRDVFIAQLEERQHRLSRQPGNP